MIKLYVICGHGAGDSGATGGGQTEADLVRRLGQRIKELGGDNVILHDITRNVYADRSMRSIDFGGAAVVELHMDAGGGSARGAHVIINKAFSADAYDNYLADKLSAMMAGRASKIVGRSDLFNCNIAKSRGINYRLVENGFIDNDGDREYFMNHIDEIARVYLDGLDIAANNTSSTPAPSQPAGLDLGDTSWTGSKMISELQRQRGTMVDGVITGQAKVNKQYHVRIEGIKYTGGGKSLLVKSLQSLVGANVDGHLGKETISKLQVWLNGRGYGLSVDGFYGQATSRAVGDALTKRMFA